MSGDKIKNSDKGKSMATSERKSLDLVRVRAKEEEKLVLDSTRRFLPGGMDAGTSGQQGTSRQQGETTRPQETTEQQRKRHQEEHSRLYKEHVRKFDQAYGSQSSQHQWNILNKAVNDGTKKLIEKQRRESEES